MEIESQPRGERPATTPRAVWFGLLIAVALDTAMPLFWKMAVAGVGEGASFGETARGMIRQPWTAGLIALFAAQFVNWMVVLSRADLSFAQPITALSYVAVCVMSWAVFGETQSIARLTGVALILLGVWLVSGTEHRTTVTREGGNPR